MRPGRRRGPLLAVRLTPWEPAQHPQQEAPRWEVRLSAARRGDYRAAPKRSSFTAGAWACVGVIVLEYLMLDWLGCFVFDHILKCDLTVGVAISIKPTGLERVKQSCFCGDACFFPRISAENWMFCWDSFAYIWIIWNFDLKEEVSESWTSVSLPTLIFTSLVAAEFSIHSKGPLFPVQPWEKRIGEERSGPRKRKNHAK